MGLQRWAIDNGSAGGFQGDYGSVIEAGKGNPCRGYRRIQGEVRNLGYNILQAAIASFAAHYHAERNHQEIENELLIPGEEVSRISAFYC